MKKLLSVLFVILIGLTFWLVTFRLHQKENYIQAIDSLQTELSSKTLQLNLINDSLKEVRQARIEDQERYDKEKKKLIQNFNKNKEKVKGLPLTDMVQYILDFYGSTEAKIVQKGDTVLVIISPELVNNIGNTIADYKDNLEKLEAVQIILNAADDLIEKYKQEVPLLERKILTQEEIIKNIQAQNKIKDEVLNSKNKEIKKYKLQRTLIAGGAIIGFVLIAL